MNKEILNKLKLAEAGDSNAQFDVGMAFFFGNGVEQNYITAMKWLTDAAEKNHIDAQFAIGHMYYYGKGVEVNYTKAIVNFILSASNGNANAQNMLAICYMNGQGAHQDYNKAIKYFELAAKQGLAQAQFNLGMLYFYGQGINKDIKKAIELFTLAADNGDNDAQMVLGELYFDGREVEQNYIEASKYFTMAAKQGNVKAFYNLGVMFYEGLGVQKNHQGCINYMKMAKRLGMVEADAFISTHFGIIFNTRWIELAVRKTLNIMDGKLTQEDLHKIKYLKIAEPYNNKYSLEISTKIPPCPFIDVNGGEEWEYCCVGKENFEKSLNIPPRNISKEFGLFNYSTNQIQLNKEYASNIKMFDETGKESTELTKTSLKIVEWVENTDDLINDLIKFKNLDILRIQGIPFNKTNFLKEFKNLKVLEMADSGSPNLETLKELKNLEQLCIW